MTKALYALASCVCATAILLMAGTLLLSVPACYEGSGFIAAAFIAMLVVVQTAFVALLPYLALTALPGYFGGERAAIALVLYAFVPHPYANWDVRCRMQTP